MATIAGIPDSDTLNDAELAFLEAVFAYKGIQGHPTENEFLEALELMSAYALQVQDNPPEVGPESGATFVVHCLSDDERMKLAAVAFMRFGVTKPTSWQWQAAHEELLAPALSPAANCH
jgi:hypothetical protein